jgi:hypothetical protein
MAQAPIAYRMNVIKFDDKWLQKLGNWIVAKLNTVAS